MLEIITMLGTGFMVGLTGALVPGPMLFATIETSLKKGWTSGPEVVFGHALIEIMIFILIVTGFSSLAEGAILWISLVGGAILAMFGIMTLKAGRHASMSGDTGVFRSPFAAGIITSISHPYFWLWWLTAGAALIMWGLKTGLPAALIFLAGHLLADLTWYTTVSTAMSRGRALMSQTVYRRVLMGCGVFLIGFGIWFMTSQLNLY